MNHYLPFKPIKGQAFRLYFTTTIHSGETGYNNGYRSAAMSEFTFTISKDGGSFSSPSNSPTDVSNGRGYVDLTASEMDADVVVYHFFQENLGSDKYNNVSFIIYTSPAELSAVPTSISSLSDKMTAIFQYLFFQREVTASAETMRKEDDSTSLGTNTVSDDGTTVTKGRIT